MKSDRWVDAHSVNCYFCQELIDERESFPADGFNQDDGGSICQGCYHVFNQQGENHVNNYQRITDATLAEN